MDPSPPEHLPGRRRRAAAGLRRSRCGLGRAPHGRAAAIDLGGDPQRRPRARRERHALRRQGQHDHARPRERTWATAGRHGDGAARDTTGRSCELGAPGTIARIEIDTNHFKGNYPDSASIEGCLAPGATLAELASAAWRELLPQTKLKAHHRHFFSKRAASDGPVSHVRLNIFPDGGVSRLRVYGTVARLDRASPEEARRLLSTCCGSSAWVERMLCRRPFGKPRAAADRRARGVVRL